MNARAKKIVLLLLAIALLFGSGQLQKSLNVDRERLGLTHADVLQNAPPVLAFTTVALGGFRGLISNYLWIRANDLQQDDKFFEAAQLADWITDLEPHFPTVWDFQAWNMAWNISIKFKDFPDRWRWVERGIELLRDNALRYNPDAIVLYERLAWIFQSKMGQNLDDANGYFKSEWAREMTPFFGPEGTNFSLLLQPQTDDERTNAIVLREKYKMDPAFAKKVDDEYGPLDWRLPETQAIYWFARGLDVAKNNPEKIDPKDVLALRRGIYQSMLQAFHHGRIIANPFVIGTAELAPNLDIIPKVNDSYEIQMREDTNDVANISIGHRNFLSDAVYYLYLNDRTADAQKWYRILGEKYPDKPILENDTNSLPRNLTLDEYVVDRTTGDVKETSQDIIMTIVQGFLANAYENLAIGEDDRSANFQRIARKIYDHYQGEVSKWEDKGARVGLPPWNTINKTAQSDLLDPQESPLPYAARAIIRSRLGMLPETVSTNTPPLMTNSAPVILTNSVSTNSAASQP